MGNTSSAMITSMISDFAGCPSATQATSGSGMNKRDGNQIMNTTAFGNIEISTPVELHPNQVAAPDAASKDYRTSCLTAFHENVLSAPITIRKQTLIDTIDSDDKATTDVSTMTDLQASDHITKFASLEEPTLIATTNVNYLETMTKSKKKHGKKLRKRQEKYEKQERKKQENARKKEEDAEVIVEAKDRTKVASERVRKRHTRKGQAKRVNSGSLPRKFEYLPLEMKEAIRRSYKMHTSCGPSVNPEPVTSSLPAASTKPAESESVQSVQSPNAATSDPKAYMFFIRSTTRNSHVDITKSRRTGPVISSKEIISTHHSAWEANLALLELLHATCAHKGWRVSKCDQAGAEIESLVYHHWHITDTGCLSAGFAEALSYDYRDFEEVRDAVGNGTREVVIREDDDCKEVDDCREEETEHESENDNEKSGSELNTDDDKENDKLFWKGWLVERKAVPVARAPTAKESPGN